MTEKLTYEELEQRVRELEQTEFELRQTVDKLRKNESRLIKAQELAHMGNWVWDINSGKVEWSNEVFKIFQLDPKQFTPQIDSILALSPWPEEHQRDKELIQKAIDNREVGSYEQKFLRPDGTIGYYFSSFQGIYNDNDKLTAISGIVQDITENKKNEEALRESREKYKSIINNIGIGIALISPSMEILELNHQMHEWFPELDLDKKPICYRAFNNPPREEICEYCPTCKTLADGKVHEDTTETPQTDNTRNYRIISSPLINSQGEVTAAIEMVEDITERLNLEAQLQHAQKMEAIGTLAGGIAHDFNNILASILGYSSLAKADLDKNSKAWNDIDQVITAGNRATDLVRQILTISRHHEKKLQPLRMQNIVQEVMTLLRSTTSTRTSMLVTIDQECPEVLADPTDLHQVIMNLCTNACYALREKDKGEQTLEVDLQSVELNQRSIQELGFSSPSGTFIKLRITDTGSGIEPETMARIFEPYYTTKKIGEGTGLGLAMVHSIITKYGGAISVQSELGVGTTFCIYLPIVKMTESKQDSQKQMSSSLGGDERILLIDDEKAVATLHQRVLSDLGYRVTTLTDAEEAVQVFTRQPNAFDLIITDMNMPNMLGTSLAQACLKIRPNIPIALCTGFSHKMNQKNMKAAGFRALLYKPVDDKVFAAQVRKTLDEDKVNKR